MTLPIGCIITTVPLSTGDRNTEFVTLEAVTLTLLGPLDNSGAF